MNFRSPGGTSSEVWLRAANSWTSLDWPRLVFLAPSFKKRVTSQDCGNLKEIFSLPEIQYFLSRTEKCRCIHNYYMNWWSSTYRCKVFSNLKTVLQVKVRNIQLNLEQHRDYGYQPPHSSESMCNFWLSENFIALDPWYPREIGFRTPCGYLTLQMLKFSM